MKYLKLYVHIIVPCEQIRKWINELEAIGTAIDVNREEIWMIPPSPQNRLSMHTRDARISIAAFRQTENVSIPQNIQNPFRSQISMCRILKIKSVEMIFYNNNSCVIMPPTQFLILYNHSGHLWIKAGNNMTNIFFYRDQAPGGVICQ